ncbi:MAG: aminotransferase class I/II-fold pyridoxal phosphate-dependent enzyme [Clostridiales bacterium]|jgi:DNA-binding transcriptional MocR family regulator|nr:aminotransferase class I/II-fold pyridoxal phosphate-dependent enzyme [Clostridiales bacterium]
MSEYVSMNQGELKQALAQLREQYAAFQARNLKLDMSRGKPGADQTDLSVEMLDVVNSKADFNTENGFDCRNYGLFDGIPEMKALFGEMLGVPASQVFVGGNSSLNLMFDTISCMMTHGVGGCEPWSEQGEIKFLCPVPGYDRHFAVTEYFGVTMIPIPMSKDGPDMDEVERLVQSDASVKGMWCVPKYSNPAGITYSDETVRRIAALKPAAKDFRIMWDNAYCVHDLTDEPDSLLNIVEECQKTGNEDLPILFCSTSKITFPGAGVAAMAASDANMAVFKKRFSLQTIGFDKLNELRHARYFENYQGFLQHMQRHRAILEPKFQAVLSMLEQRLSGKGVASWTKPNGGYFVSVDVMEGCAKRVVELCKQAGVALTPAGATYPYGRDPKDSNIRLAPTYPPVDELITAMQLFCLCVELAAVEKLLG